MMIYSDKRRSGKLLSHNVRAANAKLVIDKYILGITPKSIGDCVAITYKRAQKIIFIV